MLNACSRQLEIDRSSSKENGIKSAGQEVATIQGDECHGRTQIKIGKSVGDRRTVNSVETAICSMQNK